ncbi:uncharacterized protein HKW66_Vig0120870 [Vigna angularis]|uniref:Uncharacterized protein n=1 Tax=Phaseolus angularis TaxID=3914 RepID=A0A8T0JWZ8_PHAAN|nr:uncharacterized protein HKW66_Vig0120870 [Vigna angularis]
MKYSKNILYPVPPQIFRPMGSARTGDGVAQAQPKPETYAPEFLFFVPCITSIQFLSLSAATVSEPPLTLVKTFSRLRLTEQPKKIHKTLIEWFGCTKILSRGPSSARESGLNTVLMVRPLKIEPESQVPCFFPTSNNRVPTIASTENVSNSIQELHAKTSSPLMLSTIESPKNQGELTLDDVEMKAFYASLDAETSIMSPSQDTTVVTELSNSTPSEETKKALKTLQDLLSKDFTDLLHTGQSGTIKSSIEHLAKLSADDGISAEMRLLILEVSREFTRWSCDYNDANRKIESANANIMKADKLEENLEANKKEFKEVSSLENELSNQLSCLEKRKKELEEQINAIKANISVFQSAKVTSTKRKREAFEEAKILKAQRDELKEQVPHLKNELEVAKKNQAHIRAEWSKLGEKFNKSLNGMNHEEKLDGKSMQENSI